MMHYIIFLTRAHVDTSECYGYPYETTRSIAKSFEKKSGQLMPNHRGGVRCPILQDEHIQWSVRREVSCILDIIIESLHCKPNEVFQSPTYTMYLSVVFQKSLEVKLDLPSS